MVKAKTSREDPRATGGLVSNLPHPRVNKTKQHTLPIRSHGKGTGIVIPTTERRSYGNRKGTGNLRMK